MFRYKDGLLWFDEEDKNLFPSHVFSVLLEGGRIKKVKGIRSGYVMFPCDFVSVFGIDDISVDCVEYLDSPEVGAEPSLREYQSEAFRAWYGGGGRGVIIMPTGAGKTVLGIYAICKLRKPTLVVATTLTLVQQWIDRLRHYVKDVGEWTGRKKELKAVTVATYDSASLSAEYLGNKFDFLVFDEVHHLPAEGYRKIAEMSIARYRMGLTATLEREDNLHLKIDYLLGEFKYEIGVKDIEDYLASWEIREVRVAMSPDNMRIYRDLMRLWRDFCLRMGFEPGRKTTFFQVLRRSFSDPRAREAILANRNAKKLAQNTIEKIGAIRKILEKHKGEKILIFTDTQDFAYRISEEFLIPAITSEISGDERREYIDGFSSGKYPVLVSAHVLDEGVDVPDASVAIIVSGTSSSREFVQRLGRILRPKKKGAVLYEIISAGTSEKFSSRKRKSKVIE